MGSIKKADAIVLGITSVHAKHNGNGKYLIDLSVGSGNEMGTQSVPDYDPNELTIHWDHTTFIPGYSVKGNTEVDFSVYTKDQMTALKFTDASGTQLKGGIVIKQTDYPPKALAKKFIKMLAHLNEQISNDLFLDELDLVNVANDQWTLTLTFHQPGNKYKLSTNGFNVRTVGGYVVLELLMETDVAGSNVVTVPGTITTAQLNTSLPIILTMSPIAAGEMYYKKGAVYIE